jgi:hypothetical protein
MAETDYRIFPLNSINPLEFESNVRAGKRKKRKYRRNFILFSLIICCIVFICYFISIVKDNQILNEYIATLNIDELNYYNQSINRIIETCYNYSPDMDCIKDSLVYLQPFNYSQKEIDKSNIINIIYVLLLSLFMIFNHVYFIYILQ